MDGERNPYRAPPATGEEFDHKGMQPSRFVSLSISVAFGVVGAFLALQTLACFVFATLIDPTISGREWWRIYADNVLFSGGWWQIFFVYMLLFVPAFAIIACLLQLACALFRRPTLGTSVVASACVAGLVTLTIIGTLLVLRA